MRMFVEIKLTAINIGFPIKLFADAHVFDKEYQGARTFIKEIYSLLSQKNELRLYLGAYDTDRLKEIFPDSGNICFVKYSSRSPIRRLIYDIPTILEKYSIDYAHFQYIIPLAKKCRYIVTIHDVLFYDFPNEFPLAYKLSRKALFKRSVIKADILTTVSCYSKTKIEKHLKPKQERVHVIPNAVNKKFFLPFDKSVSQRFIREKYGIGKFILYVSRFEPRKNHISLLHACLKLNLFEQGYYLVLLGHKSIGIPQLENALSNLPQTIRKFIFISNSIDDNELLEFYRASSIFAYPSLAEGFGISPLEAGALKIPVICSNTSAMADFSFFGKTHINPNDTDLLAEKIAELVADPPKEEYLNNISKTISENYSWQKSAESFVNILSGDSNAIKKRIGQQPEAEYEVTRSEYKFLNQ